MPMVILVAAISARPCTSSALELSRTRESCRNNHNPKCLAGQKLSLETVSATSASVAATANRLEKAVWMETFAPRPSHIFNHPGFVFFSAFLTIGIGC